LFRSDVVRPLLLNSGDATKEKLGRFLADLEPLATSEIGQGAPRLKRPGVSLLGVRGHR
jgi:hypothetical protein